jgi:hypothetical protein
MNTNKKMPTTCLKFSCENCDFICSKHSNYLKHLLTRKHEILTNPNNLDSKNANKVFECHTCKKIYKHASTLSFHKKKCKTTDVFIPKEHSENDIKILTNLVLEVVKNNSELLKSNNEMHKQMMEICKNSNNTTNISHNNSHNKTFNLNFFLNEQCKDAMNIMEFVDTFQLQFADLERIGEVGYVEGISSIIINKLNEMDIYKRPIHCSDAKREIMYVKDNDVWDKDNETNDKIRLAIRYISKKNCELVIPWRELHPGVRNYDHRLNDKYQEIIIQSLGGKNTTTEDGETKIIRKISKMVLIDKQSGI